MKYSVKYYLRHTFVKAALPICVATGALGTSGVYYLANSTFPSSERDEKFGDAQYSALYQQAERIIADDKSLQAEYLGIKEKEQLRIVSGDPALPFSETIAAQKEADGKTGKIKDDFSLFTKRLIASEGISEKDAISLTYRILDNTKYTGTTYSFQSTPEESLAWLDECQNKSSDIKEKKIEYIAQCLSYSKDPISTDLMLILGFIGGIAGIFGYGYSYKIRWQMSIKNEEEQCEILQREAAREFESPKPKEQVRETKIREILKPPY